MMNLTKFDKAVRIPFLIFTLHISTIIFSQTKPFTLKIGSYRGSIQWEQSTNLTSWTSVTNGDKDSLIVQPSATTYYRAKITEQGCDLVYSQFKAVFISDSIVVAAKMITGRVKLPESSSIALNSLEVLSILDKARVNDDGTFNLLVVDSTLEEVLIVQNNMENVVMLANYLEHSSYYEISAETTASALLLLYPFLKPADTNRKKLLWSAYKAQPEFRQLISHLENLIRQGQGIYTPASDELGMQIVALINKDYNSDRFRPLIFQKPFKGNEIDLETAGTILTINNTASYSYGGAIYEEGNPLALKVFPLSGSSLNGSPLTKFLYSKFVIKEDLDSTIKIDLADLLAKPNRYLISFRNGLNIAFESDENVIAFYQNVITQLSNILNSVIPGSIGGNIIEDTCYQSVVKALINKLKTLASTSSDPSQFSYLKEIITYLIDGSTILINCSGVNVKKTAASSFAAATFKMLKELYKVYKFLPVLKFQEDWFLGSSKIDHCKILTNNVGLINCFNFQNLKIAPTQSYTCDSVELTLIAVTDKDFYPYFEEPASNINFNWLVTKGSSGFMPLGAANELGKTNLSGEASIKWKMPPAGIQQENRAIATYLIGTGTKRINSDEFITKSIDRLPAIKISGGENQSGRVNNFLVKSIIIGVKDLTGGVISFMDVSRFDIKTEIKEGVVEEDLSLSVPPFKAWKWKLGPSKGEQTLTLTIKSKDCNWPVEGSPFVIKATAISSPILTTSSISSIKHTTAVSGGTITDDGGAAIAERGICWSMSLNPSLLNGTTMPGGNGTGTFTSNITGLEAGKTYHVRAFAINSEDTAYGNDVTFSTFQLSPPTVATKDPISISQTSAISGGNIINDGGSSITAKGVCWSTAPNPNITLFTKTNEGANLGQFTSNLANLEAGRKYFLRAYATNNIGTSYGNEVSFTTVQATTPVVSTRSVSSITQTSGISGGNVITEGGSAVIDRGLVWALLPEPTIAGNSKQSGTGKGDFSVTLINLKANTKYYVRSYAVNDIGVSYGNEVSFETLKEDSCDFSFHWGPPPSLGILDYILITPSNIYQTGNEGYTDAKVCDVGIGGLPVVVSYPTGITFRMKKGTVATLTFRWTTTNADTFCKTTSGPPTITEVTRTFECK